MGDPVGRGMGLRARVRNAKRRRSGSVRWLQRQLNDPYVLEAKRQGLRSRAAFKLMELDDRFGFLKGARRIVDLGAAPGGWTQVAVARTGGRVLAVDIRRMDPLPGAEFRCLDLETRAAMEALRTALPDGADVVLSDMAPATTGHARADQLRMASLAELAYGTAAGLLRADGAFVVKLFQGGAHRELLDRLKRDFRFVRHAKPKASRKESSELYLVAAGYRPGGASRSDFPGGLTDAAEAGGTPPEGSEAGVRRPKVR